MNDQQDNDANGETQRQAILPRQTRALVLSFVLNMNRGTSELYFLVSQIK